MNIASRLLLWVTLLIVPASLVQAENGCMDGYEPVRIPIRDVGDCAPINGYYNNNDPQQAVNPAPTGRWISKWGALAIDGSEKTYGASVNASSKRKAEREALSLCKKGGGASCKVLGWMSNRCQALAWGDQGPYGTTANTKEAAAKKALNMCSASGGNCRVYHSSCSYPIKVR